jgi:hypothetical protein
MKKKLEKISDELDGASALHKKQSKALDKSSKLHKRQAGDLRTLRHQAAKKALE